ncbi:delta-60 repeat domain-containing protein [Krasilnikovia sp. MM14-A1259]|uniref:delta-60 repeat domain-containing protein n=1 Tax=Krasilnikovia sp. MM14-A1259 TaxID=3373539 RepID=UPI003813E4C3
MRRRLLAAVLPLLLLPQLVLLGVGSPAVADIAQPAVVSADPVDYTPHVLDGTVWTVAVVGDIVVVGGAFTKVTDSTGKLTFNRRNIFAYGLRTGAITAFAPEVDGAVYALAAGPTNTVYVGGVFKTVNRVAQRGLARLSLLNSARIVSFTARINWGDVRAMAISGSRLYVGGTFSAINGKTRVGLARLSIANGGVDLGFDPKLSAPGIDRTRVEHFDISPDGTKLIAVGALLRANGLDRTQIVMYDVSGASAVVTGWYTNVYKQPCMAGFDTYLRQVKFSPDGQYFVVVATGRAASPSSMCDSAARFDVAGDGAHDPTWVQRTGGDSLYAVAVTGPAVYVGGHQRYLDNPNGTDSSGPGPGAVSRPGIGALDPATGRALPWNPTRSRGVGVRVFVAVPSGLIVGSDTTMLGREYHGRIGMFPLA